MMLDAVAALYAKPKLSCDVIAIRQFRIGIPRPPVSESANRRLRFARLLIKGGP